jgi:hypothetical protein
VGRVGHVSYWHTRGRQRTSGLILHDGASLGVLYLHDHWICLYITIERKLKAFTKGCELLSEEG